MEFLFSALLCKERSFLWFNFISRSHWTVSVDKHVRTCLRNNQKFKLFDSFVTSFTNHYHSIILLLTQSHSVELAKKAFLTKQNWISRDLKRRELRQVIITTSHHKRQAEARDYSRLFIRYVSQYKKTDFLLLFFFRFEKTCS